MVFIGIKNYLAMADTKNQQVQTKRDLAYNRLRTKHQDKQFDDDEAVFGQMNDDYDEYEGQLAERDKTIDEMKKRENAIGEMFASDPRNANFFMNMRDGKDPAVELVRMFGDDIKAVLDDPARQEELAEANKDFAQRVAKNKEYEDAYQKNLSESLAYLDKLEQEGMSSDQIDAVMQLLLSIVSDGLQGKFTPESIEIAKKALNFDTAVKEAGEEGVIKGRNAKIEEKLRQGRKGDGHGPLGDEGAPSVEKPARKQNLGPLESYGDNMQDIWERGGEKRTKY